MIRDGIMGESAAEDKRRSVLWSNLFKFNYPGRHSTEPAHCELMLKLQRAMYFRKS